MPCQIFIILKDALQENWDCGVWQARYVCVHHHTYTPDCACAGQYLYEEINKRKDYEVAFVWNRTDDKMKGVVKEELILQDLADCASRCVGTQWLTFAYMYIIMYGDLQIT